MITYPCWDYSKTMLVKGGTGRDVDIFYRMKYWYFDANIAEICCWRSNWSKVSSLNGNISALLALCAGNSLVTGELPTQRPVTQSFDFSLVCAWINDCVNNHGAGYLRLHCVHYDATVMQKWLLGKVLVWRKNAKRYKIYVCPHIWIWMWSW